MAMELYDLVTLLEVLRVQKTSAPPFWLNYFGRQINFETPKIAFDLVYGDDRKLAPFVVPTAQGRPQSLEGYETRTFAPAYTKIKDVVDANMHIERMAGEAIGAGSMSIDQRRNAVIAYLLSMHKTKHQNRREWLAAKAIIDGKVIIKGEDYPETLVDFRRHASLTGVLAGAAKWDQATGDPLADLKTMRLNANQRSGARITTHVFGQDAWNKFCFSVRFGDLQGFKALREMMNINYGGVDAKVNLIPAGYEGMEYMGRISGLDGSGAIDAYVNTSKYIDEDGSEQFYLDQSTVVGVSDAVQGVRCFGAIKDKRAGYKALDVFAKNWDQEDPSAEYLLSQSSPLMVPKQPDATFSLKV
jgi:hypothetical protein